MLCPPLSYFCPHSKQLLVHPVIASDGVTYSRNFFRSLEVKGNLITLPDGKKIESKFYKDKIMKRKVQNFLKENLNYIKPISEESKKKFIKALENNKSDEMELFIKENPLLLSEKLFGENSVLQHLAQEGNSDNRKKLGFLLKIAKTKQSKSEWYGFFENHIASKGKTSVIVKVVKQHILDVNDNGFSGQNTLLHLAAKYGCRKLVKKLIIKCEANTYLKNENKDKAEDVASPSSGIAQLIQESIFNKFFQTREEEFNKKIKKLEDQNAALKKDLEKTEKTAENLRNELNKEQKRFEHLLVRLNRDEKSLETLKDEQTKMKDAHNNFVMSARDKKFFRLPQLQSTIQVKRKVEQCSYDSDDFEGKKDTYATLFNSADAPRYRGAYCLFYETLFTPDVSNNKEEKDYNKCIIL